MIRRVVYRGNPTPLRSAAASLQQITRLSSSSSVKPDHFAFPSASTTANQNIEVLDVVLHTVSQRYNIPTNANDMRCGTIAAYRALGVVLQQYATYLEKEGPSSPAARLAAYGPSAAAGSGAADGATKAPSSSLDNNGVVGSKGDDSTAASSAPSGKINDEVRQASFTSLISFLVRTLFSKNINPLETPSIADAIQKQAALNRKKRQQEFMSNLNEKNGGGDAAKSSAADLHSSQQKNGNKDEVPIPKDCPEQAEIASIVDSMNKGVNAKTQAIVERHFPMTNNFRNLLSNFFQMPTHKMVPVLGAAGGKGLGKEFREFFTGSGLISLRFGKMTAGLYPGATLSHAPVIGTRPTTSIFGPVFVGTVPEMTNVFELAHPADHVLRASINTIRVDGTVIEAATDEPIVFDPSLLVGAAPGECVRAPNGATVVDQTFFDMAARDINAALSTLDKHRPKKKTTKEEGAAASSADDAKEEETASVSVDEIAKELEQSLSDSNAANRAANANGGGASSTAAGAAPLRAASWVPPSGNFTRKNLKLDSFPHVSVDVKIDVVVPPRRFVAEFDFYEERVHGPESEGQRLAIAKLLAIHSAASITRVGDTIYKMFTGKSLKIYTTGNPTIDMLARRTNSQDVVTSTSGPSATPTVGPSGKVMEQYPFETKMVTMVYSFKDREWAIDNVNHMLD